MGKKSSQMQSAAEPVVPIPEPPRAIKACSYCGRTCPEDQMLIRHKKVICERCLMKQDPATVRKLERTAVRKAEAEQAEQEAAEKAAREAEKLNVDLIQLPPSHGGTLLDTLKLELYEGKPAVLWAVSWRGGFSHADGAGAHVPLPEELLAQLTAPRLAEWMCRALPKAVRELQDMAVYAADSRVVGWCKAVYSWREGRK